MAGGNQNNIKIEQEVDEKLVRVADKCKTNKTRFLNELLKAVKEDQLIDIYFQIVFGKNNENPPGNN